MTGTKATTFKRELDLFALMASEGGVPSKIEILQCGVWDTPYHGMFTVTPDHLKQYKANFDAGVRAGNTLPIDYEHVTDGGAAGWITGLTIEAASDGSGFDSLWANVEWTPGGTQALKDKVYKYFSPEFCPEYYVDPEDFDNVKSCVLIGGAITTRPLFKSLKPIMASATGSRKAGEDGQAVGAADAEVKNVIYFQKGETVVPTLDEARKKASSADLSTDERTLLEQNVAELSEEELAKFELTKPQAVTPVAPAAPVAPVAAKDGTGEGQVSISAGELKKLQEDAARGVQAADKLEESELTQVVQAHAKRGAIVTEQIAAGVNILKASSPKQRDLIQDFLSKLPSNAVVTAGEQGSAVNATTDAQDELDKKASDYAAEHKVSYNDALRKVRAENPELASSAAGDDNLTIVED